MIPGNCPVDSCLPPDSTAATPYNLPKGKLATSPFGVAFGAAEVKRVRSGFLVLPRGLDGDDTLICAKGTNVTSLFGVALLASPFRVTPYANWLGVALYALPIPYRPFKFQFVVMLDRRNQTPKYHVIANQPAQN